MSQIIEVPQLSAVTAEGVLSAWHKQEGDAVVAGDLLAELDADGATVELRASCAGKLLQQLVPVRGGVTAGQAVAVVGASEEQPVTADAEPREVPPAPASPPAVEAPSDPAAVARPAVEAEYRSVIIEDEDDDDASTKTALLPPRMPAATDASAAEGLDPDDQDGVGSGAVAARTPTNRPPMAGAEQEPAVLPAFADPDVYPLSTMRRAIARRLAEAKQTVPHSYLSVEADVTSLVALREQINRELVESPEGGRDEGAGRGVARVTLNDLIIKACASALVRVPACNAQFTPEAVLVHRRIDIGVSVAVPDGFVIPVVRNADTKSVLNISDETRDLAGRARARTLRVEEITQATFSISNLGMMGIDEFSAVINPPEGAMLAVGRAREAAVVREGVVTVGRLMKLTLSIDHRAVDGAAGAAFLVELRGLLERPMRILTG